MLISQLIGIAHATVLALAELPRHIQASVVMALSGRTAALRTFRRWVAWALLVGADKLKPKPDVRRGRLHAR